MNKTTSKKLTSLALIGIMIVSVFAVFAFSTYGVNAETKKPKIISCTQYNGTVMISWNNGNLSTKNLEKYEVYYKDGGSYKFYCRTKNKNAKIYMGKKSKKRTVSVKVRAVYKNGSKSSFSNPKSVTIPKK